MRDARNIILLNIQHRAILYQHITIMNIQDSSFIITQFGTGKCVIRDSAIKHFTKLTLFPSYPVAVELVQVRNMGSKFEISGFMVANSGLYAII